jgi:hypothetical protein
MADRAPKVGWDAQLERERLAKYDVRVEDAARQWMGQVLGRSLGDGSFHDLLKSGVVLCQCVFHMALWDFSPLI